MLGIGKDTHTQACLRRGYVGVWMIIAGQINIHKPKVGEEDDDETLVTIKGSTEQIDKACETINQVCCRSSRR